MVRHFDLDLYVHSEGGTGERDLATPTPLSPPPPLTFILGDSLLLSGMPEVQRHPRRSVGQDDGGGKLNLAP